MKRIIALSITVLASIGLAQLAWAGPEPLSSGKEMKEVAPAPPPPPCCDWQGFYIGINVGGQFGHSEDKFLDDEFAQGTETFNRPWGYSESGVVAGGDIGYNWQWHWLVLGPEFDVGYMNLNGSGELPSSAAIPPGIFGESSSDFYATFRGRIGVALDCWLFYATGGGIGVNYDTRAVFRPNPIDIDAHRQDFDWGYCVGGGIERRLGCHWSVKVEYLYYQLDTRDFSYTIVGNTYRFNAETEGHIVRAGLNYKF